MRDVLVVEDDQILRELLIEEIKRQPGGTVSRVRSASTLAEARLLLKQTSPSVLLLDLVLPDGSGIDLIQELQNMHMHTRVVILSGCPALMKIPPQLIPRLEAVLNKAEGLRPLREAIRSLGREFEADMPDISTLSPRQLEILFLIGEGFDTTEIAKRLGISLATAQTHRSQITGRLGMKGTRLVTFAQSLALNRD